MDKDEAIIDFLKGLRIVFNNASAYSKDHPYFVKSVENFKEKFDTLIYFLSPIQIDVAPNSLYIDARYWQKAALYTELALLFHLRKIKSIRFEKGLTTEELIHFLNSVSLPVKEIVRLQGITSIFKAKAIRNIYVEELDYSSLLREKGQDFGDKEPKDIWLYLFKEAAQKDIPEKVNEITANFENIISNFQAKDLTENKELKESLRDFLNYLKGKQKDKFIGCTKSLLKFAMKDKGISGEEKIQDLKMFFKDLDKDDFEEVLWEELSKNETFDSLSFSVFSRLLAADAHRQIARSLDTKLRNKEFLQSHPTARKKIKELFFAHSRDEAVPQFYHHALSWLSDEHLSEAGFSFGPERVYTNYSFILLNLLIEEDNEEKLKLILNCLLKEPHKVMDEKNLEYLEFLWGEVEKKIQASPSLSGIFETLQARIREFIENAAFKEGRVGADALKLFLKLFPGHIYLFYAEIEKRRSDIEFLAKVVESLAQIDAAVTPQALKKIFYLSNNIIKREVLKAMRKCSIKDDEFLFSALREQDSILKKEALRILAANEKLREKALQELLCMPSLWGRNNKLILENMSIAQELKINGLEPYLLTLSRGWLPWNRKLRKKAKDILKSSYVGKD